MRPGRPPAQTCSDPIGTSGHPSSLQARLHYILGFVGGLMAAVSVLELWPEARKCRHDRRMYLGIALGMALMGATLFYV